MSDLVQVALISATPGILGLIVGLINNILQRRFEVRNHLARESIKVLEYQTNGMQDKLLKLTGESEFAKGVKQETDKEK